MIDLATLKGMLGIPLTDTTRDTFLTMLVNFANKSILDVFNLTSAAVTSYTDRIDVDDDTTPALWTRRWPLVAVTSVTEATVLLDSTVYRGTEEGLIKLLGWNRYFSCGRDAVVVVYTAGWASNPADLVYAAGLIAVHGFNTAPRAGLQSEKIGQYSYQLGGASVAGGQDGGGGFGIPPEAERILASYKRVFTLPN